MDLTPPASSAKQPNDGSRRSFMKQAGGLLGVALAPAAVGLDVQASPIRSARVALGGVGAQPWRSREAERVLTGAPAIEATFQAAATAALQGAKPREHNHYKVELAHNTLVQALRQVTALS